MTNRFNLIDEPFSPVSGNKRLSLNEIFTTTAYCELALNPWYFIPVMRLLICIGQAAIPIKTEQDWQNLSLDAFCKAVINYLNEFHDAFYLYGERPFLQIKELATAPTPLPLNAFNPICAYGNNTVLRSSSLGEKPTDADKALLLIAITTHGLAGKRIDNSIVLSPDYTGKSNKKGKPSSGSVSPFLGPFGLMHSFYLGHSVAQSVWLNLVSEDVIARPGHGFTQMGRPCWELTISGEDCPDARIMKETYLGRLVPLVRFCHLREDDQIVCSDGIAHHALSDHFHELSMTCREGKKGLEALKVNITRKPWRDLDAFLSFTKSNAQSKADQYSCDQLSFCYPHAKAAGFLNLWCGGIAVKYQTGEQKISGNLDMICSKFYLAEGSAIFKLEPGMLLFMQLRESLDILHKRLVACASAYFDELSGKKESNGKNKLNPAVIKGLELFWQRLDLLSEDIMHLCFEPDNNSEDGKDKLLKAINAVLYRTYEEICPSSTARTLIVNQRHRPAGLKSLIKHPKE